MEVRFRDVKIGQKFYYLVHDGGWLVWTKTDDEHAKSRQGSLFVPSYELVKLV